MTHVTYVTKVDPLESLAERSAVYDHEYDSPTRNKRSPDAPTFDVGLLYFSCAHRGRAGKVYVTATHVAFVPMLFGRCASRLLQEPSRGEIAGRFQ